MISFDQGVIAYTERYLMARHLSPDYANTLRQRIASFCDWAGSDVPIGCISSELGNEWLGELHDGGMSVWSLVGYRQALLSVWTDAYPTHNNNPPLGLKKFKRPQLIVEAYTHAEILSLLDRAKRLPMIHKDGNHARDFWSAAIHVAYCCGPRRGDLLKIEKKRVAPDGTLMFTQNKTGYPVRVILSAAAIKFTALLRHESLLLPWPYDEDWFSKKFGRIRDAAGIARGTFKWIRRSAGSYAERDQKGSGARLLGHRDESVFRRFYNDTSISGETPIQPPPLMMVFTWVVYCLGFV